MKLNTAVITLCYVVLFVVGLWLVVAGVRLAEAQACG